MWIKCQEISGFGPLQVGSTQEPSEPGFLTIGNAVQCRADVLDGAPLSFYACAHGFSCSAQDEDYCHAWPSERFRGNDRSLDRARCRYFPPEYVTCDT